MSIEAHAPLIREQLSIMGSPLASEPLGLGLRLSASAASTLVQSPLEMEAFREWMTIHDCYVETLNGFPYGSFYGTQSIKEGVFKPDWASEERVAYTKNLACILNDLLPNGIHDLHFRQQSSDSTISTISTVPVSHGSFQVNGKQVVKNLDDVCQFLHRIEERSGNRIILGLEPEPLGYLDSTEGVISFFTRLRNLSGKPDLIEKHLGVTYDTCHFAVMGESPSSTLSSWKNENITVSKIQFSNALELSPQSKEELECLLPFVEPIYSHQTSIAIEGGKTILFADLPDAIKWAKEQSACVSGTRWRIHYHIPLFSEPSLPLHHTNRNNEETAQWLAKQDIHPQMEVETYTWSVLPSPLKGKSLSFQIAKELDWLASLLLDNQQIQGCNKSY